MCIVILKESTQIQVQCTASLSIADCGLEFQKFENNYSGLCLLHSIRRQVNFRVNYMLNHVKPCNIHTPSCKYKYSVLPHLVLSVLLIVYTQDRKLFFPTIVGAIYTHH